MSLSDLREQYLGIGIVVSFFKFPPLLFDNTVYVQTSVSLEEGLSLCKLFIIFCQFLIRHSWLLTDNSLSHLEVLLINSHSFPLFGQIV